MRELSIFIDESGDFGPTQNHSPFYILALVLHDHSDDIAAHLDRIHDALSLRGFPRNHAIHTGPLVGREQDYRTLGIRDRRSIFRVLVDFVRACTITHQAWAFNKRELGDGDHLVSAMSRELGALIRDNHEYFSSWDRAVIYYDNGEVCRNRHTSPLRTEISSTPKRPSPESRSRWDWASEATRSQIHPTVRHQVRISSATAVFDVLTVSHAV